MNASLHRRMILAICLTTIAGGLAGLPAQSAAPATPGQIINAGHPDAVFGSYIVVLKDGAKSTSATDVAKQYGASTSFVYAAALKGFAAKGKTLRAHIAHLRQCLSAGGAVDLIETKAPGYALAVPAERVDVHWFEDLVRLGRSAASGGAMETSVDHLRTALRLWRGEAMSDCSTGRWAQAEVTRLQEVRLFATEDLLTAELALGHHARVAAELASLVTCHPLRERMWELLMLALYHAGRPADALYAYRRARSTIVDELGLEPGPRLRKLELAILTGVGA